MQLQVQRSKTKQYLYDLAPWAFLLVLALLAVATLRQAIRRYSIQREVNAAQHSIDDIHAKNTQLLEMLSYVKSTTYTEEQARLRFGYAKEGEHLAIVPGSTVAGDTTSSSNDNTATTQPTSSNQRRWWQYFFLR